jgi:hypothetical protein
MMTVDYRLVYMKIMCFNTKIYRNSSAKQIILIFHSKSYTHSNKGKEQNCIMAL